MAEYMVRISDEEMEPFEDGSPTWSAVLVEDLGDGELSDGISVGMGATAREAVTDLDWHHDWTQYQIEKED